MKITIKNIQEDIESGKCTHIYYSSKTCWFTHLESDVELSTEIGNKKRTEKHKILMKNEKIPILERNKMDPSFTITTQDRHGIYDGSFIRRLTPRECFRLMSFPDDFDFSVVSDTQAYKQAGNSIDALLLSKIIKQLLNI